MSSKEVIARLIADLRTKLLDLRNNNKLLSYKHTGAKSHVRVVDEDPSFLHYSLIAGRQLSFRSLPEPEGELPDEKTDEFLMALEAARVVDPEWQAILQEDEDVASIRAQKIDRKLRDAVREQIGLPAAKEGKLVSLIDWAKMHDVRPGFDLPEPSELDGQAKYSDTEIQTLLFPDELQGRLAGVMDHARTAQQEMGVNILHFAIGFLEWYETKTAEKPMLAPLLLYPVEIERRPLKQKGQYRYFVKGEQEPIINITLQQRLAKDFNLIVPPIELNETPDLYFEKIETAIAENPRWRVRRFATLGLFSFSRVAMFNDLDPKNWGSETGLVKAGVIRAIFGSREAGHPNPEQYDIENPRIEAEVPLLIRDADSSQHQAIIDVMKGKNLVIKGPPGTGKSQTIANIIAAALAKKKSVLFVAEKAAALEVVKKRLDEANLGDFCLELHSTKAKKLDVLAGIKRRMEATAPRAATSLEQAILELRQTRTQLNRYADSINTRFSKLEIMDGGVWRPATVHDVLWAEQRVRINPPAFPALDRLTIEDADSITRFDLDRRNERLKGIEEKATDFRERYGHYRAHPWSFVSRSDINAIEHSEIYELVQEAKNVFDALATSAAAISAQFPNLLDTTSIQTVEMVADTVANFPPPNDIETSAFYSLLNSSCSVEDLSSYAELIEDCIVCEAKLRKLTTSPDDDASIRSLPAIAILADEHSLSDLTLVELDALVLKMQDSLADTEETLSFLSKLFEAFDIREEQSSAETARKLFDAIDLLKATEATFLSNRISTAMSETAGDILRAAKEQVAELKRREHRISQRGTLPEGKTSQSLREHAAILRSPGLVGRFGKDYKEAKRSAISLLRTNNSAGDQDLSDFLVEIAEVLEMKSKFEGDTGVRHICGTAFYGINTNFDSILGGIEFAQSARKKFAGTGSTERAIRAVLLEGDNDLIQGIVATSEEPTYRRAEKLIEALEFDRGRLSSTVENKRQRLLAAERIQTSLLKAGVAETTTPRQAGEIPALRERYAIAQGRAASHQCAAFGKSSSDRFRQVEQIKRTAEYYLAVKGDPDFAHLSAAIFRQEADVQAIVTSLKVDFSSLQNLASKCRAVIATLTRKLGAGAESLTGFDAQKTSAILDKALLERNTLAAWVTFNRSLSEARADGLDGLLACVEQHLGDYQNLTSAYHRVVHRALARLALLKHPEIGDVRAISLDTIRRRYQELDRRIMDLQREQLIVEMFKTPVPQGTQSPRASECTEATFLRNEIVKKTKHRPVREMMDRASGAIRALKPCMMLSPASVAQFLKPGTSFDLVVVDEASQMRPEEAIGCMARAKQVVIVGDPQQLPPSNFFARQDDGSAIDPEAEETVVAESILDIAITAFQPCRELLWHYRSRIGSLISFSNRHFYDDRLIVFPSPQEGHKDYGVRFTPVEGRYRSSVNVPEANQVALAAIDFMKRHPNRSLGIVALNQPQRDLILAEMDRLFVRDTQAERYRQKWGRTLEPFFVKNLENVQGDERDAIFISTVYGPGESGVVQKRFGPINGAAGDRRLNVLFSRAKHTVNVFSSMRPDQIQVDGTTPRGTRLLRDYLEFASTGRLDAGAETYRSCESEFELFVKERLEAKGYEVVAQVGVAGYRIDLGVRHRSWPYGFLLGIECDGAAYHSSLSARDRDRLRQQVLESLGWTIYRVWSTDWFADQNRELEKLTFFIEALLDAKLEEMREQPQAESDDEEEFIDVEAEDFETGLTVLDADDDEDEDEDEEILLEEGETITSSSQLLLSSPSSTPSHLPAESDGIQAPVASSPNSLTDNPRNAPAALFDVDVDKLLDEMLAKLDPSKFYEANYSKVIAQIATLFVDSHGPITFKHLSERVARAHGFQRTGSEIKQRVWAAVSRIRKYSAMPDGNKVFWPKDADIREQMSFRGLRFGTVERVWADVPYVEKLGLAISVASSGTVDQQIEAMTRRIGFERLRQTTREELKSLLADARKYLSR